MKLLAIDHLAVEESNRALYHCLTQYYDLDLTLLVPKYWRENYSDLSVNENEANGKVNLVVGGNAFKGRPQLMFYWSGLARCLKEKPDMIYINSEPENVLSTQVIVLAKLYTSDSKIVCVTWRNIPFTREYFPYKFASLHRFLEKIAFRYTDACRAFNEDGRICLLNAGYKREIRLIQWGVDQTLFVRRNADELKAKLNLSPFVIGYIGRFVSPKGIDLLIEAVATLKDRSVSLLLIGNGPEKQNLLKLVADCGLDKETVIVETVSYDEVPEYLSCMDVLVLPSRTTLTWKEQFGRVLIESMACGTCVIGSDSGEIPNVVGDAGLVFKEGNVADLRDKILKILTSDALKNELVEKGMQRVSMVYSWPAIADSLRRFFFDLVQKR